MTRIRVLALGGTIASPVDAAGGNAAVGLDGAAIIAAVPQLASVADVEARTVRATMSADLAFGDLAAVVSEIEVAVAEGIDGIVVTQGTDTLEESAYLLDVLLDVSVPVVVTGAMRNVGKPGADGGANLLAAVRVASIASVAAVGVVVVMNDEVHAARWARKISTSSPAAFASPGWGPIGRVTEDRVRMPLWPVRRTPHLPVAQALAVRRPRVALVPLGLGDDDALLRAALAAGYDGVVVETVGAGHASSRVLDALSELAGEVPTVSASRAGSGELYRSTGAYPGSEQDLAARGLLSAVALDGRKARLLLAALLAADATRDEMAAAFETASS